MEKLRAELENVEKEGAKAGTNPWEEEEWEGLTAAEKYEVMKNDLVPAQQARLSKLCIEELETKLVESKNALTKVLVEKENLRTDIRNLEAKVCFLEKTQETIKSQPSNPEQKKEIARSVKSGIIAPSKFTAPSVGKDSKLPTPKKPVAKNPAPKISKVKEEKIVKEPTLKTTKEPSLKDETVSRRRSTRSASSLANYMIAEAMSPSAEESKKRVAKRPAEGSNSAKKVRKTAETGFKEEEEAGNREPLGCMTNSPAKVPPSQKSTSLRPTRGKAVQKRNPEECKQQ